MPEIDQHLSDMLSMSATVESAPLIDGALLTPLLPGRRLNVRTNEPWAPAAKEEGSAAHSAKPVRSERPRLPSGTPAPSTWAAPERAYGAPVRFAADVDGGLRDPAMRALVCPQARCLTGHLHTDGSLSVETARFHLR